MIYLDNAATTSMYKECLSIYEEYACFNYFNPSALYAQSIKPNQVVNNARKTIAANIGCLYNEIYFTASGSEGDNLALFSTIKQKKGKVLISDTEHAAIYNSAMHLKDMGYEVICIPVDAYGRVIIEEYKKLLSKDVVLVSCIHVCNETGAINPISDISKLAKAANPSCIVHSDGVQAFGKIPVNVKALGVDLYTMSSHKIHGPKGVGAIYIKSNVHPRTFIYGGGQESNIRSATENVPGIASFEKACQITFNNLTKSYGISKKIQKYIVDFINKNISDCIINTNLDQSSPYIISFSLKNVRGEGIVHALESKDIVIGTGSACSAKKGLKRIPMALNLDPSYFDGMLRISFDPTINQTDLDYALNELTKVIDKERELLQK